jgi:hypothetical protein
VGAGGAGPTQAGFTACDEAEGPLPRLETGRRSPAGPRRGRVRPARRRPPSGRLHFSIHPGRRRRRGRRSSPPRASLPPSLPSARSPGRRSATPPSRAGAPSPRKALRPGTLGSRGNAPVLVHLVASSKLEERSPVGAFGKPGPAILPARNEPPSDAGCRGSVTPRRPEGTAGLLDRVGEAANPVRSPRRLGRRRSPPRRPAGVKACSPLGYLESPGTRRRRDADARRPRRPAGGIHFPGGPSLALRRTRSEN